jgi:hypothetical protein
MSVLFGNLRKTLPLNRPARRRSVSPSLEGLDRRCLLSSGVSHPLAPLAAEVMHQGHAMTAEVMHQVHLTTAHAGVVLQRNDIEFNGIVVKSPNFYEDYVGPKLSQLDAVAAVGQILPNGSFLFAGVNQGAIDPNVKATYVFGIDRSGKLPTGPFPGRPDIQFDATVVVKLVPGQAPTVTVNDLAHKTVTTIQNPSLAIANNVVAVNIPRNLLPSTGLTPSHYQYAYWAEDGLAGSTHIASFAPEFHDIRVGEAF